MAANFRALAGELGRLADRAEHFQIESKTTTEDPDCVPAHLQANRDTISLILLDPKGKRGQPQFVFYREPFGKADAKRIAVLGGGMESREEKRAKRMMKEDPLLLDLALLDNGEYPADFWYRYLGKGFLAEGKLPETHFDSTSDQMREMMIRDLTKRLKIEIGPQALRNIRDPLFLGGMEPRITHVLNRRLGDFTEQIADRYNMQVNKDGQLMGILISVRERFALSLLRSTSLFEEQAGDKVIILDADDLVDRARNETQDLGTWRHRHDDPRHLGIRNSSLLYGSAEAARYMAPTIAERFERIGRKLRGTLIAA